MKNILRLEEAFQFALGLFAFYYQTDFAGWMFWALLLTPDLGMLGYLVNTRVGAYTYNLLHYKFIAVICYLTGLVLNQPVLILSGIIIFSHASMDRVFGYGLKYSDDFKNTHLGRIGNN